MSIIAGAQRNGFILAHANAAGDSLGTWPAPGSSVTHLLRWWGSATISACGLHSAPRQRMKGEEPSPLLLCVSCVPLARPSAQPSQGDEGCGRTLAAVNMCLPRGARQGPGCSVCSVFTHIYLLSLLSSRVHVTAAVLRPAGMYEILLCASTVLG